jgi:hypothetical protein
MANDRWYNPGDNYILDDLSGFKVRVSESRRIPGGQTGNLQVATKRWEAQQPQDLVRGVTDDQSVQIARPRQQNRFTVVSTNVAAFSDRGSLLITVDDITGFKALDRLQIMLDVGENFQTVLISITGDVFRLASQLPGSVGGTEGFPPENMIIDLGPSGLSLMTDSFGNVMTDSFGNVMWAG